MKNLAGIAWLSLAFVLTGCPPERPSRTGEVSSAVTGDDRPVAQVNGEVITAAQYEERVESMPDYARAEFGTLERRKQYLAPLVDFEVLADEAERKGYGDDPRVIDAVKEELARKAVPADERAAYLKKARAPAKVEMDEGAVKKALSETPK